MGRQVDTSLCGHRTARLDMPLPILIERLHKITSIIQSDDRVISSVSFVLVGVEVAIIIICAPRTCSCRQAKTAASFFAYFTDMSELNKKGIHRFEFTLHRKSSVLC